MKKKIRDMKLSNKMIFLFVILLGICFGIAAAALQISFHIYDEKLHEKSLQELDFFIENINDSLTSLENFSYQVAMNTETQQQLSRITMLNYLSSEYSYEMYQYRMLLLNELYSHEIVKNVTYTDGKQTKFTVGIDCGTIPEELYQDMLERFHEKAGGYVIQPPTPDFPYLLAGRDIRKHLDYSLDYLGSLLFTCDISGMIESKRQELNIAGSMLYVYSEEGMIYQAEEMKGLLMPEMDQEKGYEIIHINGQRYFMCYLKSSQTGWMFVNLFPYSQIFGQTMRVRYIMMGGFVLLFLCTIPIVRRMAQIITRPLKQLSESMGIVETGDFQGAKVVFQETQSNDEAGRLAQDFQVMLDKINDLIHENYEKQILLKDTSYQMLQAQINPHFLYNTLNALNWMVRAGRNEEARKMIDELGQLLRATFTQEPYVTIAGELELVRSYVAIQQVRYQKRMEVSIVAEGELNSYLIPRLTLQPLVENAICYGVEESPSVCRIEIIAREEEEDIFLQVKDNGPGMDPQELEQVRAFTAIPKGNGIGLKNIQERLKMTYPHCRMVIDSFPGEGTSIQISIPKKEGAGNV